MSITIERIWKLEKVNIYYPWNHYQVCRCLATKFIHVCENQIIIRERFLLNICSQQHLIITVTAQQYNDSRIKGQITKDPNFLFLD